jgi:hypothetical protein
LSAGDERCSATTIDFAEYRRKERFRHSYSRTLKMSQWPAQRSAGLIMNR